jgi:hypothetical protein
LARRENALHAREEGKRLRPGISVSGCEDD